MKVGYGRVSTQDQNPELQTDALNNAGCKKIFVEKASGAQRNRPELKKALDYLRKGDTLVVWKLDRLTRSLQQLINTVEELKKKRIEFQCLTQDINTTTSDGKLVFGIFAALAEFEKDLIRERTVAGLEAARKRGRLGGRPSKLSKSDIQAAKAMLNDEGLTVAEIADKLEVNRHTLYRDLPGGRGAVKNGVV